MEEGKGPTESNPRVQLMKLGDRAALFLIYQVQLEICSFL
jgi:hypothetical protein